MTGDCLAQFGEGSSTLTSDGKDRGKLSTPYIVALIGTLDIVFGVCRCGGFLVVERPVYHRCLTFNQHRTTLYSSNMSAPLAALEDAVNPLVVATRASWREKPRVMLSYHQRVTQPKPLRGPRMVDYIGDRRRG